jgi:type VI secretion system protein ImpJ
MNAVADSQPCVPEAISWSEGMLLAPHHFQQNDIYWHALLRQQMAALHPYYWGVLDLALDPTELARGRVVVRRLRAVMDDGLLVDYPGHFGTQPLMLDLAGHDWSAQRTATVHLCVPVRGKGAASEGGDMQRYTVVPGEPVADENSGHDELPVDRLRPKISLGVGEAMARSYASFPLLKLEAQSRGVHLAAFHPPMLRVDASAFHGEGSLLARLRALSAAAWSKYRELVGSRMDGRPEPRYANDAGLQMQAARHLVMGLPGLDVLLHAGHTHPFELYVALARMVGFVAAIAGSRPPPALDAYDHGDCLPQFDRALGYLHDELDRLNAQYVAIELRQVGAAGFMCTLPADAATDRLLIELQPRAGQDAAALGGWIDGARIATDDLMSTLVRRRYPGATVAPASAAQVAALNLRPGAFVYAVADGDIELEQAGTRRLLEPGRTLVILGEPDDHVPAAIVLYLPRAGRGGAA